jgi:hypothetical protein
MKDHTYVTPPLGFLTFCLFCVCWLVVASHTMLAQDFGREWIRYRFPVESREASLTKIITDAGGNAYAIGTIESATGELNWLTIKYDPSGLKLWQREYDHSSESTENVARDVTVDDDGNVYVTGSVGIDVPDINRRNLTVKYDALGNEVWARLFEFEDCWSEGTHVVVNNMNGDVIVAGTGSCVDVICYDSEGNLRWQHFIDTSIYLVPSYGTISKVLLDETGNVYVAGLLFMPYRPTGTREYARAARTYMLTPDGDEVWTDTVGEPAGLPPLDDCVAIDMTLDELNNVYVFIPGQGVVLRYDGLGVPETLLTLPDMSDFALAIIPSSTSIKLLSGDIYISWFVRDVGSDEGVYQIQKFSGDTRELLWEKEDFFEGRFIPSSEDLVRFPPMQMDESGNVYLAGPVAGSYKILSYAPNGSLRRNFFEFPSPHTADYRIQGFDVYGEDKVYVAANRTRPGVSDYLVAKYAILPDPDPDPAEPIIPPRLRDYERLEYAAYAPGRDWCWTGIDIDWEIICTVTPSACPDFPVSTLTENGKTVWQKKMNKPGNFLLPTDDELPRQLSVAIPIGKSSQDVIILGDNLVHSGISAMQVSTYGKKNLVEIKAETVQGKEVPFTMTLLNKDGKEIWQTTFVAPLVKQIEAYVDEPGVALKFSAVTKELQFNYFPNPFSENITVEVVASKTSPVQVTILSMKGETILQEQIEETGAHTLDMKNQKHGLYILVLKQQGNEVRKLIELRK